MLTLTHISFFVYVIYLTLVIRYIAEIPQSLSETYYFLGSKRYPSADWQDNFDRLIASLFTLAMWAMAFTLLPAMLDVTPENLQFLVFLAIAGICFVGAAPEFKQKYEGRVHTVSAWFAAVFGLSWAMFAAKGYIPLAASLTFSLAAGFATATLKRSLTFWMELVAFNTVFLSLMSMM